MSVEVEKFVPGLCDLTAKIIDLQTEPYAKALMRHNGLVIEYNKQVDHESLAQSTAKYKGDQNGVVRAGINLKDIQRGHERYIAKIKSKGIPGQRELFIFQKLVILPIPPVRYKWITS